jgi:hypothetical protein
VAGVTNEWQEIPQMYPVHGAATAFYKSKFWVLGGSTGDDSYDHTITDKVFITKSFCYYKHFYLIIFVIFFPLLADQIGAEYLRTLVTSQSFTLIIDAHRRGGGERG